MCFCLFAIYFQQSHLHCSLYCHCQWTILFLLSKLLPHFWGLISNWCSDELLMSCWWGLRSEAKALAIKTILFIDNDNINYNVGASVENKWQINKNTIIINLLNMKYKYIPHFQTFLLEVHLLGNHQLKILWILSVWPLLHLGAPRWYPGSTMERNEGVGIELLRKAACVVACKT